MVVVGFVFAQPSRHKSCSLFQGIEKKIFGNDDVDREPIQAKLNFEFPIAYCFVVMGSDQYGDAGRKSVGFESWTCNNWSLGTHEKDFGAKASFQVAGKAFQWLLQTVEASQGSLGHQTDSK